MSLIKMNKVVHLKVYKLMDTWMGRELQTPAALSGVKGEKIGDVM